MTLINLPNQVMHFQSSADPVLVEFYHFCSLINFDFGVVEKTNIVAIGRDGSGPDDIWMRDTLHKTIETSSEGLIFYDVQ